MRPLKAIPDSRAARIAALRLAMSDDYMHEILARDWAFARHHGLEVTACQLERIFPRRDDEFLLEYNVQLSGPDGTRHQTVLGELVGEAAPQRRHALLTSLRKPRRMQLPRDDGDEQICVLTEPGLVLRLPGLDERLNGLKALYDTGELTEAIATVIGEQAKRIHVQDVQILGHRLGKRCIARCCYQLHGIEGSPSSEHSLILKLYKMRSKRGSWVFTTMQEMWNTGLHYGADVRIPRPLAWSEKWHCLWMEDVPATPLPDLPPDQHPTAIQATGQALACFHETPVNVTTRHTANQEIDLLEKWVQLVGEVYPDQAGDVYEGFQRVRAPLANCRDEDIALVHRDFYEKQVLVSSDATVFIDFDTLCQADPALDVGNFLAHLQLIRLQGIGGCKDAEAAFLAGYGRDDPSFNQRVDVYTRATLLRLACLYRFWPRWSTVCESLLEAVHAAEIPALPTNKTNFVRDRIPQ
jgi:hypothetical protein